ncbi:hypothetical protein BLNAU_16340 [Blattamonas nauphoetae]|uniref:Cyclin N-terminal domain-containing protein n=1 Tax=Blattamonas nauphoetae TaxID=2049346 RepID=A0ABQ9XDG5_9EUKA|nr:hypothetical protein BLNAU_16340 [Blattamonas nauphoetae]
MQANPSIILSTPISNTPPATPTVCGKPSPNEISPLSDCIGKIANVSHVTANSRRSYVPSCHFTATHTFTPTVIHTISKHLAKCILHTHAIVSPLEHEQEILGSEAETMKSMVTSINWIFTKAIKSALFTDQEITHSFALVEKILQTHIAQFTSANPDGMEPEISKEKDNSDHFVLSTKNYGTVLICAFIISTKYLRDHPYTNRAWSDLFNIPNGVLQHSELIICHLLGFDVSVSLSVLERHFGQLVSICRA